jgi:hypothetical protein
VDGRESAKNRNRPGLQRRVELGCGIVGHGLGRWPADSNNPHRRLPSLGLIEYLKPIWCAGPAVSAGKRSYAVKINPGWRRTKGAHRHSVDRSRTHDS